MHNHETPHTTTEEPLNIPFIAHEAALSRLERTNKRLIILNAALSILLTGVAVWMIRKDG